MKKSKHVRSLVPGTNFAFEFTPAHRALEHTNNQEAMESSDGATSDESGEEIMVKKIKVKSRLSLKGFPHPNDFKRKTKKKRKNRTDDAGVRVSKGPVRNKFIDEIQRKHRSMYGSPKTGFKSDLESPIIAESSRMKMENTAAVSSELNGLTTIRELLLSKNIPLKGAPTAIVDSSLPSSTSSQVQFAPKSSDIVEKSETVISSTDSNENTPSSNKELFEVEAQLQMEIITNNNTPTTTVSDSIEDEMRANIYSEIMSPIEIDCSENGESYDNHINNCEVNSRNMASTLPQPKYNIPDYVLPDHQNLCFDPYDGMCNKFANTYSNQFGHNHFPNNYIPTGRHNYHIPISNVYGYQPSNPYQILSNNNYQPYHSGIIRDSVPHHQHLGICLNCDAHKRQVYNYQGDKNSPCIDCSCVSKDNYEYAHRINYLPDASHSSLKHTSYYPHNQHHTNYPVGINSDQHPMQYPHSNNNVDCKNVTNSTFPDLQTNASFVQLKKSDCQSFSFGSKVLEMSTVEGEMVLPPDAIHLQPWLSQFLSPPNQEA